MNLPELHDLVYSDNRAKLEEYYSVNRVLSLGEYAILSLGNHYKYHLLPHFIVRGGNGEDRWAVLNTLRATRVSLVFNKPNLIDLVNELCTQLQVVEGFVLGESEIGRQGLKKN